jgi:hypothetical protein
MLPIQAIKVLLYNTIFKLYPRRKLENAMPYKSPRSAKYAATLRQAERLHVNP